MNDSNIFKSEAKEILNVISFGAGKQSTYMLIQAIEGKFKYKPDFAIISDTGCEPSFVYENLYRTQKYVKDVYDFDLFIVSNGNLMTDILDYVNGNRKQNPQLPFKLENDNMVHRHCTDDYKIKPLRRFLQKKRKGKRIRMWIGISLDEMQRQTTSRVKYIEHYYPLCEDRIMIQDIKKWFQEGNYPEPGKSSCIICPFRSPKSWLFLKKNYPSDFFIAEKFDKEIRNYPKYNSKAYLHYNKIPLSDIKEDGQLDMFPHLIDECYGICGL